MNQSHALRLARLLIVVFAFALMAMSKHLLSAVAQSAEPAAGSVISTVATATYIPGGYVQKETVQSNVVSATVSALESLTLSPSQTVNRPPGAVVVLDHLLTNTGNTTSSYTLTLTPGGPGCPASTLTLANVRLLRDVNDTGVVSSNDPVIASGASGGLSLTAGQAASLLIAGDVPLATTGQACVTLTALTAAQGVSATNVDVVNVSNAGVLALTKAARFSGIISPNGSQIAFTVTGSNIGNQNVAPTSTTSTGQTILVNGSPASLVLINDAIPAGSQYVAGSLQTSAPGAVRLFRLPGDPAYSYRTAEDASAIEVAVGLPSAVVPNASTSMQFAVSTVGASGNLLNVASSQYNDGVQTQQSSSNVVFVPVSSAAMSLTKTASFPHYNGDGTATITYSIEMKNVGSGWIYDVALNDPMAGSGASQFGTYTASAVPAAGQYTIVAGSLAVAPQNNAPAQQLINLNPNFTGDPSTGGAGLLGTASLLPTGGDATVTFAVRINLTGHASNLVNTATASGANSPDGAPTIAATSTASISPNPPILTFSKSASLPRRVSEGVYDIDYTFTVANTGSTAAPNVRIIDNLNCTFNQDQANTAFASWSLIGAPTVKNGILKPAASFTGNAPCNRTIDGASPAGTIYPTETDLSVVDGSVGLNPGQSETVKITVQATEKTASIATPQEVSNSAWAVSLDQNSIGITSGDTMAGSVSTVSSLLVDPEGVVYNSVTREPVAGAVVTYTRASCSTGTPGPITADQIFGATSGAYTFNADGTLSMTTGADGSFEFFFNSPPVTGECNYTITVTPPAGSGYVVPSVVIPPAAGTYAGCGAVVPNDGAPPMGSPTTYYSSVEAGLTASNAFCAPVHDNIPLDPGNLHGLILQKVGSKSQAQLGDFVDYQLTLTNKTGVPITGVVFSDHLPQGFAYVSKSAFLDNVATADPAGGSGPTLSFNEPTLTIANGQEATLRYRAVIGVGAPITGTAINEATAKSSAYTSNQATWPVQLSGGVFSTQAFVFGKVVLACPAGASSDPATTGVPGVRVYLEDGTSAITDSEGKWSLYGLEAETHVVRVDETTLPPGAVLGVVDHRNAMDPESRFLDLKNGEFDKANFVIVNCDNDMVRTDVAQRRARIAKHPDAEGDLPVHVQLNPQGEPLPTTASASQNTAVSGKLSANGAMADSAPLSQPLIGTGATTSSPGGGFVSGNSLQLGGFVPATASQSASLDTGIGTINTGAAGPSPVGTSGGLPSEPVPAVTAPPLELIVPTLDPATAFIDLPPGTTVAGRLINVRVKGTAGDTLGLTVNGQEIPLKRVGKRATLPSTRVTAWEYIGVVLQAGTNVLELTESGPDGKVVGDAKTTVIAPGTLGRITIDVPRDARADASTPIAITVHLADALGVPITAPTQVTLETERGRWLDDDLDPTQPGTQQRITGGSATFHLLPPGDPGSFRIRVTAADLVREATVALVAARRPMLGVGIVEGTLNFTNKGVLGIGQTPASAAFEDDLSGSSHAGDRAAFYFKGTIKGDILLTAAYDTAKSGSTELFRDIDPNQYYPVYGDASEKGFDAQSSGKLYVRIDKDHSYAMIGDFTTTSSEEVRDLSQTNRTLNGFKGVYQTNGVRVTTYGSLTSQTQEVEEFAAQGISGPYYLTAGAGTLLENSQTVEILVRDRTQPSIVLQTTLMTEYVDYTIEPLTGRLLFTQPVAAFDSNLNPQSIRVTYELDNGGPKYVVAGVDAQARLNSNLQLGAVASTDQNAIDPRELQAITGLARIGVTTIAAEGVRTQSGENGTGFAGRLQLQAQTPKFGLAALFLSTSSGFDNPSSTINAGNTEATARAEFKLDPTTRLRAEALYSKNTTSGDAQGVALGIQHEFSKKFAAEFGVRYGQNSSPTAAMFDYDSVSTENGVLGQTNNGNNLTALTASALAPASAITDPNLLTVRGRITAAIPGVPRAQAFVEGEQDLDDGSRHDLAVGGNYAVSSATRLYGRYEFLSSLDSLDMAATDGTGYQVGVFGVESNYMPGGRVYNEYRLQDGVDGLTGVTATGIRNTIKLSKHLSATLGLERTTQTSGSTAAAGVAGYDGNTTAVTTGLEYLTPSFKASIVGEALNGADDDTYLFNVGLGDKIDDAWTMLIRSVVSNSSGVGANAGDNRFLSRQQIGFAYRPVTTDTWNALFRVERDDEIVGSAPTPATASSSSTDTTNVLNALSTNVFGSNITLPGSYVNDIAAAVFNVNPHPGLDLMGRYAAKYSNENAGQLSSWYWAQLAQGRITQDIGKRFDLGLQGGLMFGQGGSKQPMFGVETGYQVAKNLWASVGYNVIGVNDPALTGDNYTSRGAFVRLRFKFNEKTLGFPGVTAPTTPPLPLPSPDADGSSVPAPAAPAK